jgi:hypothetical protein
VTVLRLGYRRDEPDLTGLVSEAAYLSGPAAVLIW